LENVGKPAQDLHGTIVKAVEYEESRGKHKDLKDRLAILSSEVYGLNLHQLETAEVEQHVSSTPNILLRDYKQFICSKGSGGKNARTAFFQTFAESFVKKYFKA
jgi:hypothetical protein